jgi:NAD(P)-dependent dehydrogenase (short-subunit alcohol dehydrogenase family)
MNPGKPQALAGRTAAVTGGTRGIGRILAAGLAEHGAFVEIVARKEAEIAETVAAIGPDRCHGTVADLATEDGLAAFVSAVREHDHLELLVNNAATSRITPLAAADHRMAQWDRVLRLVAALLTRSSR